MWHCLDYPCRNHFLHLLPFPFIHVQLMSPTSFSMDSLEKSIPSSSQLEFTGSYDTDRGVWMIHGMSSHSHTPGRSWIPPQVSVSSSCAGAIPRNFSLALPIQPSSQGRIRNPFGISTLVPWAASPPIPLAPKGFAQGMPLPFPAGTVHRAHGSKPGKPGAA